MLNQLDASVAIRAGLGVFVLLLVARFALYPTLCDVLRQRVFRLRRGLLLLRVDGVISPSERAYELMMRRMNGVIRFAEAMTFGRLLMATIVPLPKTMRENRVVDELDAAIKNAAPEARRHLQVFRIALGYELVRHITLTSPLAWLLLIVVLPFAAISAIRNRITQAAKAVGARPAIRRIEYDASELLTQNELMAAA